MNKATLLHRMCNNDLAQADINAISKSRGFSRTEIANRITFENFYLSPVGVEQAMATLTQTEIALLHLLHTADEIVTLPFFERLYNPDFTSSYYDNRTFTQRYQSVFKKVRTQLVRKGVLIMAQAQTPNATKMEKWHFLFPSEFAPYLPRPMADIQHLNTRGKVRQDVPRGKLLALIGQSLTPHPDLYNYQLALENGRLTIGEHPFTASTLQKWQKASWLAVVPGGTRKGSNESLPLDRKFSALDALTYALDLLDQNEWVAPNQLDTVLEVFCRNSFDTAAICRLGWEWGYLAKNNVDGQGLYRLVTSEDIEDNTERMPAAYLSVINDQTVLINLQTIPYPALEQLNQIAYLEIREWKLTAVPHLIRMGAASQETLNSPLMTWLVRRTPAFAETVKTVKKRWGKQIVHTNLHIARVKDFALRVRIEHALKTHELVALSDEYIAFPPKLLPKIKRIVNQAGHIIKNHEG